MLTFKRRTLQYELPLGIFLSERGLLLVVFLRFGTPGVAVYQSLLSTGVNSSDVQIQSTKLRRHVTVRRAVGLSYRTR